MGSRGGKVAIVGTVLGIAINVAAWQEPEAFKGVRWGSPPQELQRVLAFPDCKWVGKKQDDASVVYHLRWPGEDWGTCSGEGIGRIGDASIGTPSFHYYANRMGMVVFLFNDHQHAKLREAFLAGYGSPTGRRVQQHQNAFGARFDSEELEWVGKRVTIRFSQRTAGDLTKGVVVYTTPEFVRAEEAARAAKAKQKPKGL